MTDVARVLVPSLNEFEHILSELLDMGVRADRARTGQPLPPPVAAATYRDAERVTHAAAMLDLAGAVVLGAALSRIPTAVVQEALACGELTQSMRENLHEVMNVLALLFNEQRLHALHVRLGDLLVPDAEEVRTLCEDPGARWVTATFQVGRALPRGVVWFVVRWD